MIRDDPIVVFYPTWVKIFSWFGVPSLTLVALWSITRPAWEVGITTTQYLAGMALGGAVLYQCIIGFLALRYLNMRIVLLDEGLEIHFKSSTQLVTWEKIARMKEFSFATSTRLSDNNGNTIIFAFDNMKNFQVIKHVLNGITNR